MKHRPPPIPLGDLMAAPRMRCRCLGLLVLAAVTSQTSCDAPSVATDDASEQPPAAASQPAPAAEPPHEPESPPAAPRHKNRLAGETSPYLLMHAHNPVDWYPWGEEALAKAKSENKPIFLSIGYSSCYWCHVMERESFVDPKIAAYLNEHFVCIKVDREERPDVDEIYMTSVQMMTGGGGWPLSAFLTPDAKPFFGGTYFPPEAFTKIIQRVHELWQTKPDELRSHGDRIATAIGAHLRRPADESPAELDDSLVSAALEALVADYDAEFGGFGFAATNPKMPKFPESSKLLFLLDRAEHEDEKARDMLVHTLERMARGGIYDHLGGGFHRYSTDRYWWIPHFEKMLYDNGQLATVYSGAYALTRQENFANVARGVCDYVLREMVGEGGGFYSALDAETDAEEGKFYVWSDEELADKLGEDQLQLLRDVYVWPAERIRQTLPPGQATLFGRFFPTGEEPIFEQGQILMLAQPLAVAVERRSTTTEALADRLAPIRGELLAVRDTRERPLTDTKILTAWNGLMIRGLADAGRALDEPRYVEAATQAAEFLRANLQTEDGRLFRTYRNGQAKLNAYLDDYAFLADGLIALYSATGDRQWLDAADALTTKQIELFWDEEDGGFYFTSHDHEALIARGKDPVDSAIPSGNSVSVDNLVFLARELERADYRDRARQTLQASAGKFREFPAAMPRMARALAALLAASE